MNTKLPPVTPRVTQQFDGVKHGPATRPQYANTPTLSPAGGYCPPGAFGKPTPVTGQANPPLALPVVRCVP
jgi:hypothetical protein